MVLGAIVLVVLGITVVRYFQDINFGTADIPGEQAETQPTVKRGDGPVTYIVGGGESLWTIAEKQYGSGYNWVDIASENNLINPNLIEDGQELVIPDMEPKERTIPTEMPTVSQITENSISGATYTVADGDNLWRIAVRAYGDGYMWTDIAMENELVSPDIIHTGNVLSIPR